MNDREFLKYYMTTVNWGIIGLGDIASSFAKDFNVQQATLLAVASRNLDKANAFAEKYGIEKAYGNYEEMLFDPDIDVVYIATPHSHHAKYILKSLRAGKHVLCEKAITMNNKELDEALAVAEEKNLILAEAMTIYHMPLYHKLQDIISTGKLGKLKMIQASFGSLKEADPTNRFFNKEIAGGALLDIGVYALAFTRFFLSSQPTEILTTMNPYETGVDEQSAVILKNPDNEMAVVSLTFRAKMPKVGIVAFENGFITVEDYPRANTATITYPDGSSETVTAGDSNEALNYEIELMTSNIVQQAPNKHIQLTHDVMSIMDNLREQWGLCYDFE
ncbi:Gfo/Idh/MocA family oxidoreductase [Desemzia sp. C1]|uniref:Gfo/Idh/MocA family protein n=1 Tax=Desemzia sp. C1 TaxID=2892016 RepID=UPI001E4DA35C|nr:Gfo/Idh/MocA family oxidoreductase [Desemzia sp. C1]MCI3027817.1 Gfo/Idh/MocA family oxidoreductase [Desemzia sp. C1]